jgi:hypothetical protein
VAAAPSPLGVADGVRPHMTSPVAAPGIRPDWWLQGSDALAGVGIPFVEIHLSNVHKREPFRHHSYVSDLAVGVIAGLGATGYRCALQFAIETIRR